MKLPAALASYKAAGNFMYKQLMYTLIVYIKL